MTNEQAADKADEQEDLISQFLSDADASAEDKQDLDARVNVMSVGEHTRALILMLANWCYDEGCADTEAGRQ